MHVRAYISGGSNIDPEVNLALAARELKGAFPGARFSRCYRNRAVGFDGPDFINFAAALPLATGPEELRNSLQRIETLCGRAPGAPRWEPRSMDLDVLMVDELVFELPGLTVPRPDLLKRAFMLGPLAEIAPALLHPLRGQSIGELWARFDQAAHPLVPVDLDLAAA